MLFRSARLAWSLNATLPATPMLFMGTEGHLDGSWNPVWTENSTLAFRRPFPGGVETAEGANTSLVGLGQASKSTMGPVHFRIGSENRACPTLVRACSCVFISRWLANLYCSHNPRGISRGLYGLGSGSVIVVQHATQALPALDLSRASEVARFWADELIR